MTSPSSSPAASSSGTGGGSGRTLGPDELSSAGEVTLLRKCFSGERLTRLSTRSRTRLSSAGRSCGDGGGGARSSGSLESRIGAPESAERGGSTSEGSVAPRRSSRALASSTSGETRIWAERSGRASGAVGPEGVVGVLGGTGMMGVTGVGGVEGMVGEVGVEVEKTLGEVGETGVVAVDRDTGNDVTLVLEQTVLFGSEEMDDRGSDGRMGLVGLVRGARDVTVVGDADDAKDMLGDTGEMGELDTADVTAGAAMTVGTPFEAVHAGSATVSAPETGGQTLDSGDTRTGTGRVFRVTALT